MQKERLQLVLYVISVKLNWSGMINLSICIQNSRFTQHGNAYF